MKQTITAAVGAVLAIALAGPAPALENSDGAGTPAAGAPMTRLASDGICGWYMILGCSRTQRGAWATLDRLGGPGVGGWAGAQVVDTNQYPNFRNGWWCVADGPYPSQGEAASIAWIEAVPDAYVKAGC